MTKQYIGISRDHSGSMGGLTKAAMQDYNLLLDTLRRASDDSDIDNHSHGGKFDIFVQSTSYNRKLEKGTFILLR